MIEINNHGTIIEVYPSDESELTTGIMQAGKLELHFRSDRDIKLEQGATVEFLGNSYTLIYPQETKKLQRGYFEYTATFYSSAEQLKHKLLKDPSNIACTSFVFAGSPTDFATLVARSMGHEWSVGNCVATSYDKTIAFKEESCWAALGRVAEEFQTEWVVEGKSISLRRDERYKEDPLPLSYGKGNGFLSGVSQRGNADNLPISRLYVLGSSRNIDPAKYGASTLHLPKSWSGEGMRTDESGNYIELVEGNGAEGAMELTDLYPHRVGVVSSVVVANEAKHFYDIIDTSIPDELNYNDYRIRGEKAILKFETGALAGRQFEIRQSKSALSGYHHQKRRFELIPSEQDGFIMPSKEWAPKAGDKYAIFGIALPQEYVTRAESNLLKEAIRTLSERSLPQFTFEGEVDGIWAKRKWLEIGGKLVPSGHVLFSDPEFHPEGTVIRITSMTQKVNNPTSPSITLSTALVGGSLWNVLNRAEAQEVLSREQDRELQRQQRQSYEQALQHIYMVERAVEGVEGFSKRIKPSVIETMGLLVGSQATQHDFVERYGSLKSVPMAINYNPSDKRITISNAFIRHQTIGITSITNARKPTDYRYWSVARYTSPALTDTEQSYYIYAKVPREGKGGNYLLSPDPLSFETTTHYHLLIGTLSSVIDGDRAYNRLYGFSMVTPGQILTDTISSANGNMTINLQTGEIISDQIEFRRPDGSTKSVEEVITDTVQVGGRNLLKPISEWYNDNTDIRKVVIDGDSILWTQFNSATQPYVLALYSPFPDGTYTLSYKCSVGEKYRNNIYYTRLDNGNGWYSSDITTTTELGDGSWLHTITFKELKASKGSWFYFYGTDPFDPPREVRFWDFKFEKGTIATDWSPAPEDIQADIEKEAKAREAGVDEAKQLAKELQKAITTTQQSITDLQTEVNTTLRDGIIDEAERKSLQTQIDLLLNEREQIKGSYSRVYANPQLTGTPKTNLLNAKITYEGAVNELIDLLKSLTTTQGKITPATRQSVDTKFTNARSSLVVFQIRLDEANEYLRKVVEGKADTAQQKADTLKTELTQGLSNANILIATLEKTAEELKKGKLNTADLPDVQYLINALQKGDTKIAGGLVLSKIIALSNKVDRITAYLSGYDGSSGDGKILRAGINYTKAKEAKKPIRTFLVNDCGYKNIEAIPHENQVVTKEALSKWLSSQKEPLEKFIKAFTSGSVMFNPSITKKEIDLSKTMAITFSHSDSNTEAVAIHHDGTGHFGDIHLNGDRIDYKATQEDNPYLSVGRGSYDTIEEVVRKNDYRAYNPSHIPDKSFHFEPNRDLSEREQVASVEIKVDNDYTKVTITLETMSVNTRIYYQNSDSSGWVHTELQAKLNEQHIQRVVQRYMYAYTQEMLAHTSSHNTSHYSDHTDRWVNNSHTGSHTDSVTGGRKWRLVSDNTNSRGLEYTTILPKGTHQLQFIFRQDASSPQHKRPAYASVQGVKVLQEYRTSFKQALISPTGARFYGGRDRYFDINYNAYSNAPTAQLTGGLKVDYIDMPGVPLCGATFNSSGGHVKSFGRYRNRRGSDLPSAGYDYRDGTYTIYHSIPHRRYIPLVTPFGKEGNNQYWNLSVRVYDVSAYSFTIRLLTNNDNPARNGFSYIAFQAE